MEAMEALILDLHRETLAVMDTFKSFIWVDRYCGPGDFEIFMPVNTSALEFLAYDNYLITKNSDRMMIIEEITITTDVENGNKLKVTGRSLESLLDRRIIWNFTILTGNFQNGIKKLLTENAINPTNPDRKIPNLTFQASTDPSITSLEIDAQFHGENLLDTINNLCTVEELGWRILPNGVNSYVFQLYRGIDRSYEAEHTPVVIFSPEFDNLLESNYLQTLRSLKNVTLIAGEGEGAERKTASLGTATGLNRREIFTDANGTSSNIEKGSIMDYEPLVCAVCGRGFAGCRPSAGDIICNDCLEQQYHECLLQKGWETLAETSITRAFEGEVDATRQFIYGRDFFIGDLVQVVNEYGLGAKSRITEVVQSQEDSGYTMIPTFTFSES